MVFLDSNALFYLLGISNFPSVNRTAFLELIHRNNDDIAICSYAVYEAINNPSLIVHYGTFKQALDSFPANYHLELLDEDEKLCPYETYIRAVEGHFMTDQMVRHRVGNCLCLRIATDMSYLLELSLLPYFMDFCFLPDDVSPDPIWRPKYEKYAKDLIDEINTYYGTKFYHVFLNWLRKEPIYEKDLSPYFRLVMNNILHSFVPLRNKAVVELNSQNLSWKDLYGWLVEWHDHLWDKDFLLDGDAELSDNLNIAKQSEYSYGKHFEKLVEWIMKRVPADECEYDFERAYFARELSRVFNGKFQVKTNDFIDMAILDAYMKQNNDSIFVSFDEKLLSIIATSKIESLQKSIQIIDSLWTSK
jgi:predicted nucleic acid-binding protein